MFEKIIYQKGKIIYEQWRCNIMVSNCG
jgi:hypothetical protein